MSTPLTSNIDVTNVVQKSLSKFQTHIKSLERL